MTDTLTICARAIGEVPIVESEGGQPVTLRDIFNEIAGDAIDWNEAACLEIMEALARACLTALAENVSAEMVEAGAHGFAWDGGMPGVLKAMVRAAVGEG